MVLTALNTLACFKEGRFDIYFQFLFPPGKEPSIYLTGVDMVTGSLLPSHSDVQLSCLTGERIKV